MRKILLELTEEQIGQITGESQRYERDANEIAIRSIEYIVQHIRHKIDDTLPKSTHEESRDGERYTFIPANFRAVADDFLAVYKHAQANKKELHYFLDVGCGIGNIMLIPYTTGIIAHGIEYDENVLKYALLPIHKNNSAYQQHGIYHMDAANFKHYDRYDIVYYYCPMCNRELEGALEERNQKEMKPGAYLIGYGRQNRGAKFARIAPYCYIKESK